MATKAPITEGTLPKVLRGIVRSGNNNAQRINDVLIFGFDQYEEHGNTSPLSLALSAFVGVRGLATGQLKGYLVAHGFNPVRDSKNKSAWIVRKSKKVEYSRPEAPWFEFETNPSFALVDVVKVLKTTHGRIDKARDQGAKRHIAPEADKLAAAALEKLTSVVAELEALGIEVPKADVA